MKIYSSITGELLHIVFRLKDFTQGRENIISPDNFIQCSALKLGKGTNPEDCARAILLMDQIEEKGFYMGYENYPDVSKMIDNI